MIRTLYSLVLLVLALQIDSSGVPQHLGGSFTFELKDNEKLCFYQEMKQEGEYEVDFRVIAGGNTDVDANFHAPDKSIFYTKTKSQGDSHKFKVHLGLYEFCFSNEFSTITHKQVFFSLYPTSPVTLKEEAGEELKPGVDTLVESLLEDIHRHNTDFENLQADQQSEGAHSFHIAEDLNSKVQHWSFAVACAVIFAGMGQVYFVRKLFDSRITSQSSMQTSHF